MAYRMRRGGRPYNVLDAGERAVVERAWAYAQPVIEYYKRRYSSADHEGYVALRLMRAVPAFDGRKSSLKAWAQAQARGACRDAMRHTPLFSTLRSNRGRNVGLLPHHRVDLGPGESWDEIVEPLDEREREVLDLIYRRGCTADEAAALLGIARSTVWLRLRFALAALRGVDELKRVRDERVACQRRWRAGRDARPRKEGP
jgi:DNA-directed RNA polymerase specialized sigma24 family protein